MTADHLIHDSFAVRLTSQAPHVLEDYFETQTQEGDVISARMQMLEKQLKLERNVVSRRLEAVSLTAASMKSYIERIQKDLKNNVLAKLQVAEEFNKICLNQAKVIDQATMALGLLKSESKKSTTSDAHASQRTHLPAFLCVARIVIGCNKWELPVAVVRGCMLWGSDVSRSSDVLPGVFQLLSRESYQANGSLTLLNSTVSLDTRSLGIHRIVSVKRETLCAAHMPSTQEIIRLQFENTTTAWKFVRAVRSTEAYIKTRIEAGKAAESTGLEAGKAADPCHERKLRAKTETLRAMRDAAHADLRFALESREGALNQISITKRHQMEMSEVQASSASVLRAALEHGIETIFSDVQTQQLPQSCSSDVQTGLSILVTFLGNPCRNDSATVLGLHLPGEGCNGLCQSVWENLQRITKLGSSSSPFLGLDDETHFSQLCSFWVPQSLQSQRPALRAVERCWTWLRLSRAWLISKLEEIGIALKENASILKVESPSEGTATGYIHSRQDSLQLPMVPGLGLSGTSSRPSELLNGENEAPPFTKLQDIDL
jgi:hypothetical protein